MDVHGLTATLSPLSANYIKRTGFWDIGSPLVTAGRIEHVGRYKGDWRNQEPWAQASLFMATSQLVALVEADGLLVGSGVNHCSANAAQSPGEVP